MKKIFTLSAAGLFIFSIGISTFIPRAGAVGIPTVAQYQADHVTQIATGGTATGATVFLDTGLPPDNDSQTPQAQCPLPLRPIITENDSYDDYTFNGVELKPIGVPFDGTGIIPGNVAVSADPTTGFLISGVSVPTAGLNGTYHWEAHYQHVVGSVDILCVGGSRDHRITTNGVVGSLSFVKAPAPPPPGIGTIIVSSRNARFTTVPVTTSWDFTTLGPAPDPCLIPGLGCTNLAQATYPSLALDTYTLSIPQRPAGYALKGIEENPVAAAAPTSPFGKLMAFLRNGVFAPIVKAITITPSAVQTLVNPTNLSASFTILWDPVADIGLNPATLSLDSTTNTGTVTVSNSGAPGSTLNWVATVDPTSVAWLSVSTPSGTLANPAAGTASQSITVTATAGALAPGPHTGKINFSGVSSPGTAGPISGSVNVTFLVTAPAAVCGNGTTELPTETCDRGAGNNGVCPSPCSATCQTQACALQPSCTFSASPSSIVIPQSTNLIYSCTHVTTCSLKGGQFGPGGTPLAVVGTSANGSKAASPTQDLTTYTLDCYGEEPPPGSNLNYQKTVNVQVKVQGPGRIETSSPF